MARVIALVDGENLTARFEDELKKGRKARAVTSNPFGLPAVVHERERFAWSPATIYEIPADYELIRTLYYTTYAGPPELLDQFTADLSAQRVRRYQDGSRLIVREQHPLVPKIFQKMHRHTRTKSVDINLTVDTLEYIRQDAVDVLYLVTGDVDYLPLIEAAMRSGKRVYIAALSSGCSKRLRYVADLFIDLDETYFSS